MDNQGENLNLKAQPVISIGITQAPSVPPFSPASASPPLLPAQFQLLPEKLPIEEEEGRKMQGRRAHLESIGKALNASERTAELAESRARSRSFRRDYGAKVEDETYAAY